MSATINENMLPEASPEEKNHSGVRKVNNLPLYILGSIAIIFTMLIAFVAYNKAESQKASLEQQAVETVNSATNLANNILGKYENGIIPAEGINIPKTHKIIDPIKSEPNTHIAEEEVLLPPQKSNIRRNNTQGTTNNYTDESYEKEIYYADLERLNKMRVQMLEEAIKAKSNVQILPPSSGRVSSSPREQLAAINQSAKNSNRVSDPTEVYQTKIERLRSLINPSKDTENTIASLSGDSNNSQSDDFTSAYRKRSGTENWKLDSQIEAPETPFVLRSGLVIPSLLITGINSELPGQITAQVSQDIYDTATGRHMLIPQGSRLIGAYSSRVAYGQSRVLVAWDRIIFPDGKALDIGGMQGSDSAGYSGYRDKVNTHFWKVFSSAFLMSGIIAGVNLSQESSGEETSSNQRASDAMSEALGQQLGQAMTQMIMKNLNIAPTIEIRPGYRFNVVVNKDVVFEKPYESFDY